MISNIRYRIREFIKEIKYRISLKFGLITSPSYHVRKLLNNEFNGVTEEGKTFSSVMFKVWEKYLERKNHKYKLVTSPSYRLRYALNKEPNGLEKGLNRKDNSLDKSVKELIKQTNDFK